MLKIINASGLSTLLKKGPSDDVILLDVREEREFESGHLAGAVNIPMSIFDREFIRLPKESHIIVVCLIGHRSKAAAKLLAAHGYSRVSCLKGGMLAWHRHAKKGNM